MIYLDGCRLASGCTVLLRNNPDYSSQDADSKTRSLLSDVKSVFLLLVQIMYHCKLEVRFRILAVIAFSSLSQKQVLFTDRICCEFN